MNDELSILLFSAISLGFLHTIVGPDHYLPFIAMSKACKWSKKKTLVITTLCGFGHVLSSVILGIIGLSIGFSLNFLENIDSLRGDIAAWALISFGLLYMIWGVRYAFKKNREYHWHHTDSGKITLHSHAHTANHFHNFDENSTPSLTPWLLFIIFVFGPCEVLIPLLIYPSLNIGINELFSVILVFGITTIVTMNIVVAISMAGIEMIKSVRIEKYYHAMAGGVLLVSGILIRFFGF